MNERAPTTARRRGLSVRMQLTLSYAALLVLVGVALLVVGLLILRFIPDGNLTGVGGVFAPGRVDLIAVYLRYSLWALLALAAVGLGGGWWLAGRMLAPLTRITQAAQSARDGSLSHRIHMPGRRNELSDLADTFDSMLARLERAVSEHQRFAANASHELRTPHAVVRTMLEVARRDPAGRDVDQLLSRIHEMNERSIVLTEALLTLAEVDQRRPLAESLSLDGIVESVVDELAESAAAKRVTIRTDLKHTALTADAVLVRQLVANLLQNAVTHNHEQGTVLVATYGSSEGAVLEVANTGDVLTDAVVATLTDPFVRGAGRTHDRSGRRTGSGLGLAIVSSIARVHGAAVAITSPMDGGLKVRVLFPEHPTSDVSETYRDHRTGL